MTTRICGLEIEGTAVDLFIEDGKAGFTSEREIDDSVVCEVAKDLEDRLLSNAADLNDWRRAAGATSEPVAPAKPRRKRGAAWLAWAAVAGAALLLGMAEVIGLWQSEVGAAWLSKYPTRYCWIGWSKAWWTWRHSSAQRSIVACGVFTSDLSKHP